MSITRSEALLSALLLVLIFAAWYGARHKAPPAVQDVFNGVPPPATIKTGAAAAGRTTHKAKRTKKFPIPPGGRQKRVSRLREPGEAMLGGNP